MAIAGAMAADEREDDVGKQDIEDGGEEERYEDCLVIMVSAGLPDPPYTTRSGLHVAVVSYAGAMPHDSIAGLSYLQEMCEGGHVCLVGCGIRESRC